MSSSFNWITATDTEVFAELDRLEAEEMENGGDGEYKMSEAELGWANVHNEEMEAIRRQNVEDAEYAARPTSSYMGVKGSWSPEDGWIYEP